jgi:hypothetical protein
MIRLEPPPLYFLHIPKTGGTSLASILRTTYAKRQQLPQEAMSWMVNIPMSQDMINRYTCYICHFGASLYTLLDKEVTTITILRDPFERTVSDLYHIRRNMLSKPEQFPRWKLQAFTPLLKGDLQSALNVPAILAYVENIQTRMLGASVDLRPLFSDSDRIHDAQKLQTIIRGAGYGQNMTITITRAKQQLDTMAAVGTTENFDQFVGIVCDWLGIPRVRDIPNRNIAPVKKIAAFGSYRESGEFSPAIIERIDEITQVDRIIYQYAQNLLAARLPSNQHQGIISIGPIIRRLARRTYRRVNSILPTISLPKRLKRLHRSIVQRWF